jgi:hypothetical protein
MILTVGDSFTYGDELTNRLESAWPFLLGRQLGVTVKNLGQPGTCNDSMVRKLVKELSRTLYSVVVVGWTDVNRFEAWNEFTRKPDTIMPYSESGLPWVDDYYRHSYHYQYAWERWIQQILLVQAYLTQQQQQYVFISVSGQGDILTQSQHCANMINQIQTDRFVGWPDRGMIQIAKDTPHGPNNHPLELGHERIANEIATYIRH